MKKFLTEFITKKWLKKHQGESITLDVTNDMISKYELNNLRTNKSWEEVGIL